YLCLLAARSQLTPAFLLDADTVMRGRLLDVGEGKLAIGIGHAFDLIKAGNRVPHMARVGERLFALTRKGVHAFRQIAAGGEVAMFGVGHPSGLRGHLAIPPLSLPSLHAAPHVTPILELICASARHSHAVGSRPVRPRRAQWRDRSDGPAPAPESRGFA